MRLIARFAQEQTKYFEIVTVYDEKTVKEKINKECPTLTSISQDYPAAVWFERKISNDFGIKIFDVNNGNNNPTSGILLSPTHPYHLESCQFKISDKKQSIMDFSMIPFSKHRGIEKMIEGLRIEDARVIVERISASQSIAYQKAFLSIELQSTRKTLPHVVQKRHMFLLELERMINHLSDLAMLCQLLKFYKGATFFVKHADEARKAMKDLTGHRFGFSALWNDNEFLNMDEVYAFLFRLEKELLSFDKWIEKKDKFLIKKASLGMISKEKALDYGLVGIMARCVGIPLDRREEHMFSKEHGFHMNLEEEGDTISRFHIRISEILTSLRMMKNLVETSVLPFCLGTVSDGEYYAYVESAAGEVMMYVSLENALIKRFFVRDPSFLNAQVLPFCMEGLNVSNLELITKSIPLNISAIDL